MKKCVFAGTFDPPTLGHKAAIEDCLSIFDQTVAAVMINPSKKPFFTQEQRLEMLKMMFPEEVRQGRLKVIAFSGTVARLLEKEGTEVYVRGIRGTADLEYENANLYAGRKLDKDMVGVYLPCRQELLHVSSSMVRNSLLFSEPINDYVTPEVEAYINAVYAAREKERRD